MVTKKQEKVLSFIKQYHIEYGNMPTLNEIAQLMSVKSPSTIHQHVKELVRAGKLKQDDNYAEIQIIENRSDFTNKIPVLGIIAAGSPISVIEDSSPETITVDNLPRSGDFYALQVQGDSMVDEGIFDGDLVVLKKQSSFVDGQTVVAIIDDNQATLKKIYKDKKGFRLQPANQNMLPLFRNEVEVRGVVWEVRRSFKNRDNGANSKTWKTLDLFAGIGGIRLGFENTGSFTSVFSNDFEKTCKSTYDLNFEDAKLVVEDITKIQASELPDFDFLLAGFPCQAFSIAGYRKGFEDDRGRGNLFFDIARIIKAKKPAGFLLENVKNLKTHDSGRTFNIIQDELIRLGYHIKYKVLNSMEYGNVPQNRERIYIVGFMDQQKIDSFDFPEPIKLTKKITDILEDQVDEKYYYDGKPLYEKLKNDVTEEGQVYQWRRQYVRQNKKGVCPTLTANMGMGGHNVPIIFDGKGIRKLTPRECARVQGFPDSYKLPKIADSALYKQIGNSVSVPVIEQIAKQIVKSR